MPQLSKVHVDDGLSEVASQHLDEFMRQYVWKIVVGAVLWVPFGLNVYNPIHNSHPKFPNRLKNLPSHIIIQLIKRMLSIHAKALQKLLHRCIIDTPPSVR